MTATMPPDAFFEKYPMNAEWRVARALLYSKPSRQWFRDGGYGPNLFHDNIAKAVVAWSLTERAVIPGPIKLLMAYRYGPDAESFEEFALREFEYPEGFEKSTESDEVRYQWEAYHLTRLLARMRT